jgi:hypothetical protein
MIEKILAEREKNYGDYAGHAYLSQNLKRAMADSKNWEKMPDRMRESLEMVQHKIARILNGNPHYADSWHDIIGYVKLIIDDMVMDEK